MNVAASRLEVGVRDLKNNLSRHLGRVQAGEEVIVTDRGRPVVRLSSLGHPTDRLAELVASARFARRGADPAPPGTVDHGQGLGERSRRRTAAVITYVDTSTPLKLSIDEGGSGRADLSVLLDDLTASR
jgi:prevent-host-death family protein